MENKILTEIRNMSVQEQRNLSYDVLVNVISKLTPDEIIELSNIIGYPVFTRLCMDKLRHKFVLLQDGAAAIIVNKQGQILLQSRADRNKWGLPGGCQELGERFQDTIIREVKEETNLDVNENDLEMLKNTMPTLDKYSFDMIPNLGQGEAVITGNSIKVPLLIKVNKEEVIKPNSDDVILTSLWKK